MKSARSYQREIKKLKDLITDMQWVQPAYNGSPSCACCGEQQHQGCAEGCQGANITGDWGVTKRCWNCKGSTQYLGADCYTCDGTGKLFVNSVREERTR